MDNIVWSLRTLSGFTMVAPVAKVLFILLLICWDYPLLVPYFLLRRAWGRRPQYDRDARALPLLVVIPSLLRKREELESMMSTVDSVATNGYPGRLIIVITI